MVLRREWRAAAKSLQSCPTPSDPTDCSLPGSSIHGILQARLLEWGAIAFSKGHSKLLQMTKFFLNVWEESWWTFKLGFLAVRKTSELVRWGTGASPYTHLWGRSVALSGVKRWFPSRTEHPIRAMVKLKVQEEITCITYLVLILMTKNSKIWALLSFHNYSNDFYLLLHLHFSQRQKKKKGDEKMK